MTHTIIGVDRQNVKDLDMVDHLNYYNSHALASSPSVRPSILFLPSLYSFELVLLLSPQYNIIVPLVRGIVVHQCHSAFCFL
jgi:hypothetical protein